jgi:hypothetical protein
LPLEVTIVGAIAPVLQNSQTLGLSAGRIGAAGSAYVTGAVVGALLFGWLTDRFGRRLVFYAERPTHEKHYARILLSFAAPVGPDASVAPAAPVGVPRRNVITDTPALSDGRQFQFVRKPLCAGDGKAAHLLQPGPVSKIDPVVLKIFALPYS